MRDDLGDLVIKADDEKHITDDNPFIFWVAYKRDGEKFNYLGDGKGNIRLFKTRQALVDYLATHFQVVTDITVHSIIGKIALPEAENKDGALISIKTLAADNAPKPSELLRRIIGRKKRL